MPLDSDMKGLVDQLEKFATPRLESVTFGNARNFPTFKNAVEELTSKSLATRTGNLTSPNPAPVGNVEHILIPTGEGDLLARVFTPNGSPNNEPFPVLVYFHGGGWVIANLDVYEASCRALCNASNCIVVSVAYRQSPEAKFPAAVNDAHAALQWVLSNADKLGGDLTRVAVGGESAGGNLATVACLKALDENGRLPVAQVLIYPVTDMRMGYPSQAENENTTPLHTAMLPWFYDLYLNDESEKTHPYASPILAENLGGLPPAIVVVAEFDPLRDEGTAYARLLAEAGVPVRFKLYEGVTHEFFGLAGAVAKATTAVEEVGEALTQAFDGEINASFANGNL